MQPRLAACRALLAEGDVASEHFEDALRLGGDARPFDLARIQLLYGEHLRRERRRTDARIQLRAALKGFERLQAEPWAERTRAELRASGERARTRDPSTISQLTPQELQVARYVAEGLSNKAIAAQLFLSPRTIDSHLRNVFAKLEITSRTQLASLPLRTRKLFVRLARQVLHRVFVHNGQTLVVGELGIRLPRGDSSSTSPPSVTPRRSPRWTASIA